MRSQLLLSEFQCPECSTDSSLQLTETQGVRKITCVLCGAGYPCRNNIPVLIESSNELFDKSNYEGQSDGGGIYIKRRLALPSPSVNLAQRRVLADLGARIIKKARGHILILGSGRQREVIEHELGVTRAEGITVICCDVDVTADVDVFCDAHRIPFPANYFDAVITTAVLEHVMHPDRVAAEISRVVCLGGWIYSELPFMQQVHEGAYDFTRYTMSGHRRLLHEFREIESGIVAGPATTLVWAIEHFTQALFGYGRLGVLAKAGARLMFFWLKYFDLIIGRKKAASDGASCTYFFGEKAANAVSDLEIVRAYDGARTISHT